MEIKENQINEYICYCNKVTGAMENSNCAVNNPKGTCCYSDIVKVYKEHR